MKRAVNIEVSAIDSDHGFTIIVIRDRFSGNKLKFLSIHEEDGKVIIENILSHTIIEPEDV